MLPDNLYVYIVLLSPPPVKFLTLRVQDEEDPSRIQWLLPRYTFPPDTPFDPDKSIALLCQSLNLDTNRHRDHFRLVAELLPPEEEPLTGYVNPSGLNRLLLVEPNHPLTPELPAAVRWSNPSEVWDTIDDETLFWYYYYIPNGISSFLNCYVQPEAARSDVRATERWTHKAIAFLECTVQDLGLQPTSHVMRIPRFPAELFYVNTTNGKFYLKGCRPGVPEVALSAVMAQHFPLDTLDVVCVNEELNCFVTRGANMFGGYAGVGKDIYEQVVKPIMLKKLVRFQRWSYTHLDELKRIGVADYSPEAMEGILKKWCDDELVLEALKEAQFSLQAFIQACSDVCAELKQSALKCTLVHGDYVACNYARRDDVEQDNGLIAFDWEMSYISHPCCDLYRVVREVGSSIWSTFRECWPELKSDEQATREVKLGRILAAMAGVEKGRRLTLRRHCITA